MLNRQIIHAVEALHQPECELQQDCFLVFYDGTVKRAKAGFRGPLITGIRARRFNIPIPKSALPLELAEDGPSFILVSNRSQAVEAARIIHEEYMPWNPRGAYVK